MDHKKLVKGEKYILRYPNADRQELVIFIHERLNYFVFDGIYFQHLITHSSVNSNIFEL